MKQRLENCKYCGKKLKEGTTRKEFCSDIHRVYWHRENPKIKLTNFNKSNKEVRPKTEPPPKSNYTINTTKPEPMKFDLEKMLEEEMSTRLKK